MDWVKFTELQPTRGRFIAAIRLPYPSYYWIGFYKGVPEEEEELFDLWVYLENLPED